MMYVPKTQWTWSFMLVAIIQAAIAVALEAYVFARFEINRHEAPAGKQSNVSATKTIPTYLSIFVFGFLYENVLVWDALRLQNTIQVIGICLYNIGILIYASIQIDQIRDAVQNLQDANEIGVTFWEDVKSYLVAVPCVIAVGTVLFAFLAWKLYEEFAWKIYKQISADLRLKRRYLTYQIYIALLKFDFFFFLGFTVQFLVIVVNTTDVEFYLTIAALPITILILLLAGHWTRRESVFGMIAIIVLYFCALAYFLFKLIRMYASDSKRVQDYLPARTSLTVFAAITILLLVTTITTACLCTHNFDKGLKPHLTKSRGGHGRKQSGSLDKVYTSEMPLAPSHVGSRMVID